MTSSNPVIAIIIGFGWGGWTTAAKAEKKTAEAVLASQAAICVAQFMKQSNHQNELKEFEKVSVWERDKYIEKGGWDKMPGQEEADYNVRQACADGLGLLLR